MKKTIKMLIDRILDLLCLWLGLDCPARRADVDAGICDFSGQGRDTYGR